MRILIIHASAGAGHQKAAEALASGFKKYTEHDVLLVDALDSTGNIFKNLYRNTYFFLISKVPWLWGFVFGLLDAPSLQPLIRSFRRLYNLLNTKGVHQLMTDGKYDYIISTHFMPTEIAAALKRNGKIKSKLITVVTDYDVHRIWTADGVDLYCVASDWTHEKLRTLGVPPMKILVSGIPTHENFSKVNDIAELKKKVGIKEDVFTVLVATGSFGIGPIEKIISALNDFQVIVVCGHNKGLFERLSAQNFGNVKVFGLVDNMHELMAVSDTMVTKPGGLSITEALVSQLPMIFFNAIPGQETNNIKVLKEYGIGSNGGTVEQIADELRSFHSSKDKFLTAVKRTKQLAHPEAVKDIIKAVI